MVSTIELLPRAEAKPRRGGQVETFHCRAEIPRLIDRIARLMTEQSYGDRDIFAVRLALEEALVNALKHGNHDDPGKRATFVFLVGPERVLVEVQDEGAGFDPKEVPDPLAAENLERSSGRGLHLMRTYMTWVRFDGRGNCVTMCKSRTREE